MNNVWTDRINFKRRIEKQLYPLLKPFLGKPLTTATVEKIKDKIAEWVGGLDVLYDCTVTFEIDKVDQTDGSQASVIKFIKVVPLYVLDD